MVHLSRLCNGGVFELGRPPSIQHVNVLPAVADCFATTSRGQGAGWEGGGKGVTSATVQARGRVIGVLLVV